jgi:hypothetical protein
MLAAARDKPVARTMVVVTDRAERRFPAGDRGPMRNAVLSGLHRKETGEEDSHDHGDL